MILMYKIGVLGDKDSVMGFRALGLAVEACESTEQAREKLKSMAESGFAIIYITEQLADGLARELEEYREQLAPAVIPIPGNQGSLGLGMANVKNNIERAVGADIIGD